MLEQSYFLVNVEKCKKKNDDKVRCDSDSKITTYTALFFAIHILHLCDCVMWRWTLASCMCGWTFILSLCICAIINCIV
jgi:hypothetical protein